MLKSFVKNALRYKPLSETEGVRGAIDAAGVDGLPYCPPYEGDLLFSLIRKNGCRRCLETGFHTGSTALYMAAAVADRDGQVVSICVDDDESVQRGLELLRTTGHADRHRLIRENSNRALPELFLAGERFDFIFMDGWKTFDHLAFEMYYFNQILDRGGVIAFDDSYMPSVRKAITLLKRYYGYEEVNYRNHNQTGRLRLLHYFTQRSLHRPYRALIKMLATEDQIAIRDWHFYRRISALTLRLSIHGDAICRPCFFTVRN